MSAKYKAFYADFDKSGQSGPVEFEIGENMLDGSIISLVLYRQTSDNTDSLTEKGSLQTANVQVVQKSWLRDESCLFYTEPDSIKLVISPYEGEAAFQREVMGCREFVYIIDNQLVNLQYDRHGDLRYRKIQDQGSNKIVSETFFEGSRVITVPGKLNRRDLKLDIIRRWNREFSPVLEYFCQVVSGQGGWPDEIDPVEILAGR